MLAGGLYERTSGAAGQPLAGYRRREPERTVRTRARHAQTMLAEVRAAAPEGGGLPRHVERELTEYLRCGVLAHGFARVRCTTCHDEIVVAFSCKRSVGTGLHRGHPNGCPLTRPASGGGHAGLAPVPPQATVCVQRRSWGADWCARPQAVFAGNLCAKSGAAAKHSAARAESCGQLGHFLNLKSVFSLTSTQQTARILLPRGCHASRKQRGTGRTSRDTGGAQVCMVTAGSRDG